MKSFGDLLNQAILAWISLISKIKSLFQSNKHTSSNNGQSASNGNDHDGNTRKTNVENKIETQDNEIDAEDEQEVFCDALTEQDEEERERDEEEFFDAVESLDEQGISERKECEKDKYYSLQDGLQEKTEFDRTTHTLALAFEIDELQPGNCNSDLNKFKLCELKQNGNKYTLILKDDRKNRIELHSEYLNIYFPKYFEKHCEKSTYTGLFSPKEDGVSNDIIIPLRVPKEVSILTEEFGWMNPRKVIQSKVPDFPMGVYLKDCKDHVNFHLNLNNTVSLSMTSAWTKSAAALSGTPTETNWLIKNVLVRGEFANIVNKHTYKQPEAFEVVDVENTLGVKSRITCSLI